MRYGGSAVSNGSLKLSADGIFSQVKDSAKGHWRDILVRFGLDPEKLDKGQPCPRCGGTDRYHKMPDFDDTGGMRCRKCEEATSADGIGVVAVLRGVRQADAAELVADYLGITVSRSSEASHELATNPIEHFCLRKGIQAEDFVKLKPEVKGNAIWVPVYSDRSNKPCGQSRFFPPDYKGMLRKGDSQGLFLQHDDDGAPVYPDAGQTYLIVEGCKDQAAAMALGFNAVGFPSSQIKSEVAELFRGTHVVIVPDLDDAGFAGKDRTASRLAGIASSVKWARLPGEFSESSGRDLRDALGDFGEEKVRQAIDDAELIHGEESNKPQQRIDDFGNVLLEDLSYVDFLDLRGEDGDIDRGEFIVDGLIRDGEVGLVVAASKEGKSWFAGGLAWSVAYGLPFLGRDVLQGKVLLIDNELKPREIDFRHSQIVKALEMAPQRDLVTVLSRRGKVCDAGRLIGTLIADYDFSDHALVILDCLYKAIPDGKSENDNEAMGKLMNQLQRLSEETGCAVVAVHHAPKGDMSNRSSLDLLSGASSFARSLDTVFALRPHEQEGYNVLEFKTRTNVQQDPETMKFDFPLWTPIAGIEPVIKSQLTKQAERQQADDQEADRKTLEALQQGEEPASKRQLRSRTGFGEARVQRCLDRLVSRGDVLEIEGERRGRDVYLYRKNTDSGNPQTPQD